MSNPLMLLVSEVSRVSHTGDLPKPPHARISLKGMTHDNTTFTTYTNNINKLEIGIVSKGVGFRQQTVVRNP